MHTRLKELRKLLGMNQEEFGEKIHLTKYAISYMELGKRKIIDRTVDLICREFNVNKEWLVNGKGEIFKDCLEELDVDEDVKELTRKIFALDEEDRNAIINMINLLKKKNGL